MTRPTRARVRVLAWLTAAAALAAGCSRSPNVAYARLLDQTASWAAAIDFAGAQLQAGDVPRAYFEDLVRHASREVNAARPKLQEADGISSSTRAEAAKLSQRLASLIASSSPDFVDSAAELRAAETALRTLADSVRLGESGAP